MFLHTLNPSGFHLTTSQPESRSTNNGSTYLMAPRLCTGVRLQVKPLHINVIEAEAASFTECGAGETVFINGITMSPYECHVLFKRLQFPQSTPLNDIKESSGAVFKS